MSSVDCRIYSYNLDSTVSENVDICFFYPVRLFLVIYLAQFASSITSTTALAQFVLQTREVDERRAVTKQLHLYFWPGGTTENTHTLKGNLGNRKLKCSFDPRQ